MAQQTDQKALTSSPHQPKKSDLVFHSVKTFKLMGDLLRDRRVAMVRKVAYVGLIGAMLAAVLFPEVLSDAITAVSPFLPFLGIELPAEGVIDWMAFLVTSFSLLRLFPSEIVAEHYDERFKH